MPLDEILEWAKWQMVAATLYGVTLLVTCVGFTVLTIWILRLRRLYNGLLERMNGSERKR